MKLVKLLECESIHYRNKNVDTFIYLFWYISHCVFFRQMSVYNAASYSPNNAHAILKRPVLTPDVRVSKDFKRTKHKISC